MGTLRIWGDLRIYPKRLMNKYSVSYWVPRFPCRPREWSACHCRLELKKKWTHVCLCRCCHTALAAVRHCCMGQCRWTGTRLLFTLFSSMSHMHACFLGSYTDTYTCINNVRLFWQVLGIYNKIRDDILLFCQLCGVEQICCDSSQWHYHLFPLP